MTRSAMPSTLGEHYTIECEIGRGGMATVYRAQDRRHHRAVAVKILDRALAASIGTARFLHEITTVAGLSHPNIVPLHDSGDEDGVVYYVMPHIVGETLRERLDSRKRIPLEEVVHIALRVASALDFAHRRGVVHRDIKPENIMLFEGEPLILDFGISKAIAAAGGERLTQTGLAVGTPAYLSPEQASGEPNIDGGSDQYSLACTIYEMVAGVPPFTATSLQRMIAKRFTEKPRSLEASGRGVSSAFADAVTRALSLESKDRFPTVTAFARALAAGLAANGHRNTVTERPSVAVLPFTNISADAENDFFADGITEEIINALTRIRRLDVPSRTASFAFKGRTEEFNDIAQKLNVSNILEGSVRKSGNRLRVTVQLVAAATGNTIWSDRYDRELSDVFAIQDEITANIVGALKVVLHADEESATRKVPTRDIRAYEYYLHGRQLHHQRRPETLVAAEEMYTRAIAIDPDYALAYAGLADSSAVRYGSFGGGQEALSRADEASRHALKCDPSLAEGHASRGLVLSYQCRFDEADAEFKEALRLDPASYDTAYHYARMLVAAGRQEDALDAFKLAASLRPEDYDALSFVGMGYAALGRAAEANEFRRRTIEAAERALAINPSDPRALSLGAVTLLELGEAAKGREWSQRSLQLDPGNAIILGNAACFFSLAGEPDVALDYLERAIELGFNNPNWLLHDPDMAAIRNKPRFQELLRRMEDRNRM